MLYGLSKKKLDILKELTILFVEDDPQVLEVMKSNLEDFFKQCITAKDGNEAIEIFKSNIDKIDLIITDINMPHLSGIEMLKEIREISSVSVIVTTAYLNNENLKYAIEYGVDGFLAKPTELSEIFRIIPKILTKKENEILQNSLQKMNINLEHKVEEKVNELREKDKMILNQSKYALMGEIIDAIAHQWKQPLATIDMLAFTLGKRFKNKITIDYVNEKSESIREQITHLNATLNEFRNFFRTDKSMESFRLFDSIQSCRVLVKDDFIQERIKIEYIEDKEYSITGFFNEFKHVLLNLINNSKDAFIENNISDRIVKIEAKMDSNKLNLMISDNAGGVDEEIIQRIFEPNFTTKEKKGTGIGLYICTMILDKIDAKIGVKNIYEDGVRVGVQFSIQFKSYQI
jgi:C4-dicarboxylate-specific signal transduction histidine kinase